ncbi:nuclear transport factor 2 family protein [Kitasatospora sp. NBC_00374]|uniref:nuclear transport factor 2 family protein n=1 Tax=Kitasatospora sp. NBC_00374 TaxID=2975964 RepID=UPI0030DFE7AD
MTVSIAEFAALEARVQVLVDRADITNLIDRHMISLDADHAAGVTLDEAWARRNFTEDVRVETPVGDHVGIGGLAESQQTALSRFARTQHLGANHLIDLDGDRATVRWNVIMTHVHLASTQQERGEEPGGHFDVGGTFDGEVVRTAEGWRFRRLAVRPVWFTGRPPLGLPPKGEATVKDLTGDA